MEHHVPMKRAARFAINVSVCLLIALLLLFSHPEQYAADHYVKKIRHSQPLMVIGVTGCNHLVHKTVVWDFLSNNDNATIQVPKTVVKTALEKQHAWFCAIPSHAKMTQTFGLHSVQLKTLTKEQQIFIQPIFQQRPTHAISIAFLPKNESGIVVAELKMALNVTSTATIAVTLENAYRLDVITNLIQLTRMIIVVSVMAIMIHAQ
jgi:hypothetical protein